MIYTIYMNEKKMFSFYLENDIKERLKVISKHRNRSIAYLTNQALVEGLKVWEEKLKRYNESKTN
jgi:hypothetical protein